MQITTFSTIERTVTLFISVKTNWKIARFFLWIRISHFRTATNYFSLYKLNFSSRRQKKIHSESMDFRLLRSAMQRIFIHFISLVYKSKMLFRNYVKFYRSAFISHVLIAYSASIEWFEDENGEYNDELGFGNEIEAMRTLQIHLIWKMDGFWFFFFVQQRIKVGYAHQPN